MTHWLVRYTRRGMEPPRPFGKTKTIVCADTRDEAKTKVNASPSYPITASKTDEPVSFDQRCSCHTCVGCGKLTPHNQGSDYCDECIARDQC